jgi:hypothetical protein
MARCQVSSRGSPKPLMRWPASSTGATERSTPKKLSPGRGAVAGIHPARPGMQVWFVASSE